MITVDAVDDDAALFLISPSHKAPSHWKLFQLLQKKTSWKKAGWDSFVCNILTKWFASERVNNHQKQFYWLIDIFNNFSNKNYVVLLVLATALEIPILERFDGKAFQPSEKHFWRSLKFTYYMFVSV